MNQYLVVKYETQEPERPWMAIDTNPNCIGKLYVGHNSADVKIVTQHVTISYYHFIDNHTLTIMHVQILYQL